MDADKPYKKNLAEADRALRVGGKELSDITGEEEDDVAPRENVLQAGFRRLLGVKKPTRTFGNPEDDR